MKGNGFTNKQTKTWLHYNFISYPKWRTNVKCSGSAQSGESKCSPWNLGCILSSVCKGVTFQPSYLNYFEIPATVSKHYDEYSL